MIATAVALFLLGSTIVALQQQAMHISLLKLVGSRETNLSFAPNELSKLDITYLLISLVFRSLIKAIVKVPKRYLGIGQTAATFNQHEPSVPLPALSLSMPLRITQSDLDRYKDAINVDGSKSNAARKTDADELLSPAHLALLLSGLSEPAMLLLLASKCPIDPIGAVNVRNRFEIRNVSRCRRLVSNLEKTDIDFYNVVATLPKEATRVKRGVETNIVVSIMYSTSSTQHTEIYRQTFTVLEFVRSTTPSPSSVKGVGLEGDKNSKHDNVKTTSAQPGASSQQPVTSLVSTRFRLTTRDPYRWAALCADYNPIHMSPTIARLLGFKGKIAHGNHVVAKAIESFLSTGTSQIGSEKVMKDDLHFVMELSFKRPITVPCEVVATQATLRDQTFCVAPLGSARPSVTVLWAFESTKSVVQ